MATLTSKRSKPVPVATATGVDLTEADREFLLSVASTTDFDAATRSAARLAIQSECARLTLKASVLSVSTKKGGPTK